MDNFTVRSAKIEDLEILLSFEQGIIKAERPYDSTLAKDPITYYDIKELILSDKAEVVVVHIIQNWWPQVMRKYEKRRHI